MTRRMRVVSLLLTICMIANCLFIGVITPGSIGEVHAADESLIVDGSFATFADANTVITSEYMSKGDEEKWNGATLAKGWKIYVQSNTALMQPSIGNAQDGNVCMKITPHTDGGRMKIRYDVPTAVYDSMVEGAEYKFTVWFKGEGADFQAQIDVKNRAQKGIKYDLTDGQWVKVM